MPQSCGKGMSDKTSFLPGRRRSLRRSTKERPALVVQRVSAGFCTVFMTRFRLGAGDAWCSWPQSSTTSCFVVPPIIFSLGWRSGRYTSFASRENGTLHLLCCSSVVPSPRMIPTLRGGRCILCIPPSRKGHVVNGHTNKVCSRGKQSPRCVIKMLSVLSLLIVMAIVPFARSQTNCTAEAISCFFDDACTACADLAQGLTESGSIDTDATDCPDVLVLICSMLDTDECDVTNEPFLELVGCFVEEEYGCSGFTTCENATPSPTASPTAATTSSPTASTTASPTTATTASPTAATTASPTTATTASPTIVTTASPTAATTASPTAATTASPTTGTTASPTIATTASPTSATTVSPTTATTASPTAFPTTAATAFPTTYLTTVPTASPTTGNTALPTASPTASPTTATTALITATPTASPTTAPTIPSTTVPSDAPTASPTAGSSSAPVAAPIVAVTDAPQASGASAGEMASVMIVLLTTLVALFVV